MAENQSTSNTQSKTTTSTVADAAAAAGVKAAPQAGKKPYPSHARVRTVGSRNDMVHLHTGTVINRDSKKIPLDSFAIAQIEAGKWEIDAD